MKHHQRATAIGADYIRLTDAADLAGVSHKSMHSLRKRNRFRAIQREGVWVLRRDEVEAYIAERKRRELLGIRPNTPYHASFVAEGAPAPHENPEEWSMAADEPAASADAVLIEEEPTPMPVVTDRPAAVAAPPIDAEALLAALRQRIEHERAAVLHQFSGINEQIKRLEAEATQLMHEEERLNRLLANAEDLAEFARRR